MKVYKIFLGFIFATSVSAKFCEVTAPNLIVWNKENASIRPSNAIKFKNCENSTKQKVTDILNDFSGKISQRVLITETGLKNLKLTNEFTVKTLEDFLNEQVNLPADWRLINAKPTAGTRGLIVKNHSESISVQCSLCQNTGQKTIKIEVVDAIKNKYSNYWLTADVAVKTEALVSETNLKVDNSPLIPSHFSKKTLYSPHPERFFLSSDQIIFYKVNKPINKGQTLNFSDLSPVDLVSMGRPVSIVLKNNALSLEGSAVATQSGRLGDRIRLKNNRTNKIIIGKIIDFNKAEVEL